MAVSINRGGGSFLGCPCDTSLNILESILRPLMFGNSHVSKVDPVVPKYGLPR